MKFFCIKFNTMSILLWKSAFSLHLNLIISFRKIQSYIEYKIKCGMKFAQKMCNAWKKEWINQLNFLGKEHSVNDKKYLWNILNFLNLVQSIRNLVYDMYLQYYLLTWMALLAMVPFSCGCNCFCSGVKLFWCHGKAVGEKMTQKSFPSYPSW